MKVTIICPICGFKAEIDEFVEGSTVECPKCRERFSLDVSVIDTTPETLSPQTPPQVLPLQAAPAFPQEKEGASPWQNYVKAGEKTDLGQGVPKQPESQSLHEEKLPEFPEKPFSTPILAKFLHILSLLILLGGGAGLIASLAIYDRTREPALIGIGIAYLIGAIIFALIISGIEQILVYIAEMRFHAIRHSNLMIKMLNSGAFSRK